MEWLKFLYYKYYKFQCRVGNGDIAVFSSALFITFILILYSIGLLTLRSFLFPQWKVFIPKELFILFFVVIFVVIFMNCIYKKKYLEIIEFYENKKDKKNYWGILFPLIGFVLFNVGFILKILQNKGIL